jgi:MFS family permease
LWAGFAVTLVGDQLARVALALLVFGVTGSAVAAAGAFAVTLLPALLGGPLLAGLADRYPRRTVMVACDVACAGLTAVMAVPAVGLPVLFCLAFVVALLASPFAAARSALVRDVFPEAERRYAAATAVSSVTVRVSQVAGYAAGGVLVAGLGARAALGVDAATFAVSAVVVRLTVTARPAAGAGRARAGYWAELGAGVRVVFGDRRLRRLTFYAWLAAFHIAPAAVVAPLVAHRGGGPVAVGVLLAAWSAGTAVSMTVLARVREPARLLVPLAVLAAAPLIGCAADPGVAVTAVLWALSGAGSGYQLAANVAFVAAVPDARRGQAFGLVTTGLLAGQGAALLVAGALTSHHSPATVLAGFGVAGTAAALALAAATGDRGTTRAVVAVAGRGDQRG